MKPTPFHVSTATIEYKARRVSVNQWAVRKSRPTTIEESVQDSGRRIEDRLEDDADDDHGQHRGQIDHGAMQRREPADPSGDEQCEHQPDHGLGDNRQAGEQHRVLDRLPHRPPFREDGSVVVEADELGFGRESTPVRQRVVDPHDARDDDEHEVEHDRSEGEGGRVAPCRRCHSPPSRSLHGFRSLSVAQQCGAP